MPAQHPPLTDPGTQAFAGSLGADLLCETVCFWAGQQVCWSDLLPAYVGSQGALLVNDSDVPAKLVQ